jgi:hypothetical protein
VPAAGRVGHDQPVGDGDACGRGSSRNVQGFGFRGGSVGLRTSCINECNGGTARNIATVSSGIVISPPSSFILIASSSSWQNATCNTQHTTHNTRHTTHDTQHTTDCDQSAVPSVGPRRATPRHAMPCAKSTVHTQARTHERARAHTHARTHACTHAHVYGHSHGLEYTFLPRTLRPPTHPTTHPPTHFLRIERTTSASFKISTSAAQAAESTRSIQEYPQSKDGE